MFSSSLVINFELISFITVSVFTSVFDIIVSLIHEQMYKHIISFSSYTKVLTTNALAMMTVDFLIFVNTDVIDFLSRFESLNDVIALMN